MLISAVPPSDSVIHMRVFHNFSIMFHQRILNIVPWTSLFIHCIYNSLHLLIPNSQSIPPLSLLSSLATRSLFSMSMSLFLKIQNASWISLSSFCRGHANFLCIVPVFSTCVAKASNCWKMILNLEHYFTNTVWSSDHLHKIFRAYKIQILGSYLKRKQPKSFGVEFRKGNF